MANITDEYLLGVKATSPLKFVDFTPSGHLFWDV